MRKIKIFISSVQDEFSRERKQLGEYIFSDSLLGLFFEPFLFEQLPAVDITARNVFLNEVERCDIYLAILGAEYGSEDDEGISPTEREFDRATKNNKTRLVYIKKLSSRHPKESCFVNKVQNILVRKSFTGISDLKVAVYSSLINYLIDKEIIRTAPFDATVNLKASVDDIDKEKVRNFIRLAKAKRGFSLLETAPLEKVLTHLNLLEESKITNAAILLFGKNPQRFFVTSEVRCASFYGNIVEKPIPSYKVFKGDVFELVDQALEFVLNKLNYRIETREEHVSIPGSYEIPKDVIAEAIVNAVVHRDYNSNASVQVMVFRDRVEIWNPGILPMGWTTDKLKELHSSMPKNPLIAEPMFLTAYIERLGTGTTDIVSKSKSAGLEEPEFIQDDMFRTIIFRHSKQLTHQDTHQDTHQVEKLILAMGNREVSRSELMKEVQMKDRVSFRENYLNPSIKLGYIEMTLPEKPNSRNQKYRLTTKGFDLKKRLNVR